MLERIGAGTIHRLAGVGELSIQFWAGLRASPHVLPVVGKRGRWRAAIQQMSAIGVDALPMIAIVTSCAGFIFAMQSGAELRRFDQRAAVEPDPDQAAEGPESSAVTRT